MTISQQISEDLRESMKAKNVLRTSCLRMLKAAIKNREVDQGHDLNDEEIQSVIASLIRKGQESASEFRKGNREDLAQKEENEVKTLYGYLPTQLTPSEIEGMVKEVISELSASSPKDLGRVMKLSMERMAGKAPGKEVNEIARRLLS